MIRNGSYQLGRTIDNRSAVELIERAHDNRPYCPCGRHTTPVYRDGAVWLECSVLQEPAAGKLRRLLAAMSAPVHVRAWIADVPPARHDGG